MDFSKKPSSQKIFLVKFPTKKVIIIFEKNVVLVQISRHFANRGVYLIKYELSEKNTNKRKFSSRNFLRKSSSSFFTKSSKLSHYLMMKFSTYLFLFSFVVKFHTTKIIIDFFKKFVIYSRILINICNRRHFIHVNSSEIFKRNTIITLSIQKISGKTFPISTIPSKNPIQRDKCAKNTSKS